jgi:hypothetical protein
MAIHQPAHQPAMIGPHLARRLELFGAAIVALAIVLGLLLIAGRVNLAPWTTAQTAPTHLVVSGASGGAIEYTGIPYPIHLSWVVDGTSGGGIAYTGIPYESHRLSYQIPGTNGGGIIFTGIPYPAAY